jgi:hypothetical protein
MENENELQDSQNLEELALPETLDAEVQAAVEALKEKNKQLYARAKKAEEEAKALKAKEEARPVEQPKVENPAVSPTDLERLNLKVDGYSNEEVNFIMKNGGANAISDEFVIAGIEALRAKKKKEIQSDEANPSISSKSPIFKKYSEDQVREMPLAELEKLVKTLPSK